jgi:hypothetical protein
MNAAGGRGDCGLVAVVFVFFVFFAGAREVAGIEGRRCCCRHRHLPTPATQPPTLAARSTQEQAEQYKKNDKNKDKNNTKNCSEKARASNAPGP